MSVFTFGYNIMHLQPISEKITNSLERPHSPWGCIPVLSLPLPHPNPHRNASPRLRGAFRDSLFLKCVITGFVRGLGFWNALLLTIFCRCDLKGSHWALIRRNGLIVGGICMYVTPLSMYHSGPFGFAEKPCGSISRKIMPSP